MSTTPYSAAAPSHILQDRGSADTDLRPNGFDCMSIRLGSCQRILRRPYIDQYLIRYNSSIERVIAAADVLRTAGSSSRFARADGLNRRAGHGAVRAEHAAIPRLRLQLCSAAGAFIEKLTGVRRHRLGFLNRAMRAGDGRYQNHRLSFSGLKDSRRWSSPMSVGSRRLW